MRFLLSALSALGLVHAQGTYTLGTVSPYTSSAAADGSSLPVTTGTLASETDWSTTRTTDRGNGNLANGSLQSALNQLESLLNAQLDKAKKDLGTVEENFDKNKCTFEKQIKKNAAKSEDEQQSFDTATAQAAKWDAKKKNLEGQKDAEKAARDATLPSFVTACTKWMEFVCTGTDSLLKQLQQAVDDAALLYAALSKLAERRAEFNFGATIGLLQMSPEQTEKIEITEEDVAGLRRIDGLTGLVQQKVNAQLDARGDFYGAGAGGVVGALKGIYDTTVTNAQRLVVELNTHGIEGSADELDETAEAACTSNGLGLESGAGATCPTDATNPTLPTGTGAPTKWSTYTPVGHDTYSALMRTQLAQYKAHNSKLTHITTSFTDASSQFTMWSNKETDAQTKLTDARDAGAIATVELQQARTSYDEQVSLLQTLIADLTACLEAISDPRNVAAMAADSPAFIQIEKPVGLIQTSTEKSKLELTQQADLAAQADSFNAVVGAMQKMIANLQNQIQDELDRKTWCVNEENEAETTNNTISSDVSTLEANLQAYDGDISLYEGDIETWEGHAKDIEEEFNDNMDVCGREMSAAQEEKDDAAVNERVFSKIKGILENLRTGSNEGEMDAGTRTTIIGHVNQLLTEARNIQDRESTRIEDINKWCNTQRDQYAQNIRHAKSAIAKQRVMLSFVQEEYSKTDRMLAEANEEFAAASSYKAAIDAQCTGLISGAQAREGEWKKEIVALTSIIEMLTTGN